jgi:hypothetical protein
MAACLWACCLAEHYGGEHIVEQTAYLMAAGKQNRVRGKASGPIGPRRTYPPMAYLPSTESHSEECFSN